MAREINKNVAGHYIGMKEFIAVNLCQLGAARNTQIHLKASSSNETQFMPDYIDLLMMYVIVRLLSLDKQLQKQINEHSQQASKDQLVHAQKTQNIGLNISKTI